MQVSRPSVTFPQFWNVSSRDRLWNAALQAADCAAIPSTPAPFQSHQSPSRPRRHCIECAWNCSFCVSMAFSRLILRVPFVQCHAVVCTCSRIWNLAASIGILHKDQTMTNLDRNVRRLAARGKVLVFKDENVWGGHVGRDSSSCPNWFFFCYVFHMAFSWLFKSSGLGFVFLQGIQINPATSFGHSI